MEDQAERAEPEQQVGVRGRARGGARAREQSQVHDAEDQHRDADGEGDRGGRGRAQDADLVLVDDYASGRHARLFPQGTRWFLEDLGSTNGTYVNGAPVTRAVPVGPGTAIRIGKTVMELEA